MKAYYNTPEVKARMKAYKKAYYESHKDHINAKLQGEANQ